MDVKGIIWLGSVTDSRPEMSAFMQMHLGLSVDVDIAGFTRLLAANGDRVELFGPGSEEHELLDTGPVAGFLVDDAAAARSEMLANGVPDVTKLYRARDGHHWFYFRAPDGNYYELCESSTPRTPGEGEPAPSG